MIWLVSILAYLFSCAFAYGFLEPYIFRREMKLWAAKLHEYAAYDKHAFMRNADHDPPVFAVTFWACLVWPLIAAAAIGRAFSPDDPTPPEEPKP